MDRHTPSLKRPFWRVQSWLQSNWKNGFTDASLRGTAEAGALPSQENGGWLKASTEIFSRVLPASLRWNKEQEHFTDALRTLQNGLAETTRLAEPDFAQLTRSLSKLNRATSDLTALIEKSLSAVLCRLENIQIGGEDGAASETLTELRANLQDVREQIAGLTETVCKIGQLQNQSANIRRIGSFLTACSLNFSVECARSSDTAQEFTTFCHDLRELANNVAIAGTRFGDECGYTHAAQTRAIKDLKSRVDAIEGLISPAETVVSATTRDTRGLVKLTRRTLDLAAVESGQITRQSHDALFHLQLGDIIRQKCEHVVEAIEVAHQRTAQAAADSNERNLICAEVNQILAIQFGQLERMTEEITTAHRQLSEAFTAIGNHTRQLASQAEALTSLQSDGKNAKSLFASLEGALKKLEEIQTNGFDLREEAIGLEDQAKQASNRLGDQLRAVRRINADIHLQSLNAIIRTCHLGEQGHTLGVLAMHMHGTFQDSNSCVQEVIATLRQVIEVDDRRAPDRPQNGGALDGIQKGGSFYTVAGQIAELYEELHGTAERALNSARDQEKVLNEVRSRLEFLPALAAHLQAHGEKIAKLREKLRPRVTASLSQTVSTSLGASYTMESEREIHRRIAQGESLSSASTAPVEKPADDLDGIDFFDLPSDATGLGGSELAKVSGENTEEDKSGVSPTSGGSTSAELPDLGDNVELF